MSDRLRFALSHLGCKAAAGCGLGTGTFCCRSVQGGGCRGQWRAEISALMCSIYRGCSLLGKVTVKASNEANLGHVKFEVTFEHTDRAG